MDKAVARKASDVVVGGKNSTWQAADVVLSAARKASVVVVGGKNSACEAALVLCRAGAHVTMVRRGAGVWRFGEMLGQARHRELRERGIDRAHQRESRGDSVELK